MPNMAGLSNAGKIEELEKAVNMLMKAGKPKLPVGTCVMKYQKADKAGMSIPEDAAACQRAHKRIVESFPISRVYQAHIPTYPSGHWLFGFASKKYHPLRDLDETRWNLRGMSCKYYTTTLHKGAFYLPAYVEELLKDVE